MFEYTEYFQPIVSLTSMCCVSIDGSNFEPVYHNTLVYHKGSAGMLWEFEHSG